MVMLKVGELTSRDESGRGIVRIDTKTMQKLGAREGDIVQLEGQRTTGALAVRSYPADVGLNIIRMDGITRRNAGIGVGENIKVVKAKVQDARRVLLAPIQKGVIIQMNPQILKKNLFMRPVSKKDIITPYPVVKQRRGSPFEELFGSNMFDDLFGFTPIPGETKLVVANTTPSGIVRITEGTEVELSPEAVELEDRAVPTITYEDIGGLKPEIEKIREMVELPLRHPEIFAKLGIDPPKGVLLYGPPGTGKTLLARAVASESGAHFISVSGPEFMSKWYGQSEQNLRKIFKEAEKNAPSIIFIDEIDSIAPKREEVTGEVERRVVSQMLTLMDGLKKRGRVIVIAATNRENALDAALRRGGRFDREIEIGVPDQKGRKQILQIHTRNMPLEQDVNLNQIAAITYGYVGADVEALCKEAAMSALRRVLPGISWKETKELPADVMEKLRINKDDFQNALKMVEPSAMREVLVEVPNIRWDGVGGLDEVKQTLKEVVEWPLKKPEAFRKVGIKPPKGVLLYGPPGTGKTMLAKAVATESEANFISIRGPELLSKWVGESEKHVRDVFRRAKQVAPSIIFFDEIDAIAPRRGMDMGSRVTENVVSTILTEMSGLEDLYNVVVIAATNRPDVIDPALLRPGRFDRKVIVPAPDDDARLKILKIHTKDMPLAKDVNLQDLVEKTERFSGADLEALVTEAGLVALREMMDKKAKVKTDHVKKEHFLAALKKVRPSINQEMTRFYANVEETLKEDVKQDRKELTYVG